MISEEQIIKGCIENDRNCQKLLFKKYHSKMLGICLRYAKTRDEAEDVLIDAFVSVFNKIKDFRNECNIEVWIRKITVNTAINNYRKNLKHYYHNEIENYDFYNNDLKIEMTDNMSVDEILKLVQELPSGYRTVFNMYAIEGYSHQEISQALGISEGTSKSQLFKARKALQEKLNLKNKK